MNNGKLPRRMSAAQMERDCGKNGLRLSYDMISWLDCSFLFVLRKETACRAMQRNRIVQSFRATISHSELRLED